MDLSLFMRGLVVGFAIAAPVGPIGLLCIQRTLAYGRVIGLVTGLGAATADAIYGLVAGLGLTAVSTFLAGQQLWLGLIGGLFLCYLGVRTFMAQPAEEAATIQMQGGRWGAYFSTLLLTLTNPMTIFSFMAVFAGLGLATSTPGRSSLVSAATLVTGVFLGSAMWWLLLSGLTSLLLDKLDDAGMGEPYRRCNSGGFWRLFSCRLIGVRCNVSASNKWTAVADRYDPR